MKKNLSLAAMLSTAIFLNANANFNEPVLPNHPDWKTAKELSSKLCYVKLNDGKIREYKSLKLINGLLKSPHLLADGKLKISPADILEYSTTDHVAVSQKLITGGRRSNVSTETLPGFAVLLLKGPLNVYSKKYYNGTVVLTEFFIQSGNDGAIFPYSDLKMKELLSNQPEALLSFLNAEPNDDLYTKLKHTIDLLNTNTLTAKN